MWQRTIPGSTVCAALLQVQKDTFLREETRRKSGRWLAGIALVGVLAVGIGMAWPRERLLTKIAHPVTESDTLRENVVWLSDRQLLIITRERKGGENDEEGAPDPTVDWHGFVDLLDTVSRKRTRQTALTDLLNRTTKYPLVNADDFKASPDGAWLQWKVYERHSDTETPRTARIDGTHYRDFAPGSCLESPFLDYRHLLQFTRDKIILRDLWNSGKDREYSKPEQAQNDFAQYTTRQPAFIIVRSSPHDITNRTIEIDIYQAEHLMPLLFAENEEGRHPPDAIRIQELKLPQSAAFYRAEVSPQQQTIFYDLEISRTNPFRYWLHRLLPKIDAPPTFARGIWVSRADGSGMREIGHTPFKLESEPDDWPQHIQWLPDGKQVSFVYHDTLYVVPAEPEK